MIESKLGLLCNPAVKHIQWKRGDRGARLRIFQEALGSVNIHFLIQVAATFPDTLAPREVKTGPVETV